MKMWFGIVLGRRSRPGRLQVGSWTKPSNPNADFLAEKGARRADVGTHFEAQIV